MKFNVRKPGSIPGFSFFLGDSALCTKKLPINLFAFFKTQEYIEHERGFFYEQKTY